MYNKGSFQKGTGYYYNDSGILIKEIDFDKPYRKFSWGKLLEFLKNENISMEQIESIGRREDSIGFAWYVSYINDPITDIDEVITIDAQHDQARY